MFRSFVSLLLGIFWFSGCAAQPKTPASSPTEFAQWSGPHGGSDQPSSRVVRTAADWETLWQQLGREAPRPLASGEMAVAVFLGERRTGGFHVEVVAARDERDAFVVEYREHLPAPDRMVTQVLTSPWTVAVLPVSEHPVVVRKLPDSKRVR